ncbi:MAG TPA: response regulator, partial [Candidatus Paceibacterota bacterium]|nr:response regulator [Candidatus Paceibacterota bacterium]
LMPKQLCYNSIKSMAEQPLILIVDDEPDFREIFGLKLKSAGYRIETATNGSEGIEKAKALKPDLILMDVKMPVMDGAAAVLKLREDPATKNVRIAFLTSLGDPHAEMQEMYKKVSEDFGAQGYLKKTDDLELLTQKIKGFLQ